MAACRANVKSGAIMSALSDTEIQREIGGTPVSSRSSVELIVIEFFRNQQPAASAETAARYPGDGFLDIPLSSCYQQVLN